MVLKNFDETMTADINRKNLDQKRLELYDKKDVPFSPDIVKSRQNVYDNRSFESIDTDQVQVFSGQSSTSGKKESARILTIKPTSNQFKDNSDGLAKIIDSINGRDADITIKIDPVHVFEIEFQVIITVANSVMAMIPVGFLYSLGVIFVDIIDEYQASRAEASPILSVHTAILLGFGGIFGPIMNRFNGGYVCMLGGMVAFIGCIVSYLANSVAVLIFGIGVVTASGLSAPLLLPFIIVAEIVLPEKRPTMIAIIGMAVGIGPIIFPYLTAFLMDEYGWRGVILIYSSLILNIIPLGYLNALVKKRLFNFRDSSGVFNRKEIFNLSVFRKVEFLVIAFCVFLIFTLFPTIILFFVDMIRGKGFDVATASALLSINGFVSMGGRIFFVVATPFMKCSRMFQWTIYLFVCSITISLYVVFDQYIYLLVTCIIFGFFWGICMISYPAMILEVVGQKRYANAMGYTGFIDGLSGLIGAPIAGFVKDKTGSYDLVFFVTTGLGLLACSLLIFTIMRKKRKELKTENIESTEL